MKLSDAFLFHLVLAFVVGGGWVGSATFAARRFHSGIGGLIGGLPSISSISFFFIGLGQSTNAVVQATIAFPLGLAFTILFLLVYASLAGRGFTVAMTISLLGWFILSGLEAYVHLSDFPASAVAVVSVFLFSLYVLKMRLKLPYVKGPGANFSFSKFLEYALPGGTVVTGAVFASQILGPTAGGVAAAFPAIFSLTLAFTYTSEGGMRLSRSMTKPLMISAVTVAFPYSIFVGLLYPLFGLYLGTVLALTAVMPLVLLAYLLVHRIRL